MAGLEGVHCIFARAIDNVMSHRVLKHYSVQLRPGHRKVPAAALCRLLNDATAVHVSYCDVPGRVLYSYTGAAIHYPHGRMIEHLLVTMSSKNQLSQTIALTLEF